MCGSAVLFSHHPHPACQADYCILQVSIAKAIPAKYEYLYQIGQVTLIAETTLESQKLVFLSLTIYWALVVRGNKGSVFCSMCYIRHPGLFHTVALVSSEAQHFPLKALPPIGRQVKRKRRLEMVNITFAHNRLSRSQSCDFTSLQAACTVRSIGVSWKKK